MLDTGSTVVTLSPAAVYADRFGFPQRLPPGLRPRTFTGCRHGPGRLHSAVGNGGTAGDHPFTADTTRLLLMIALVVPLTCGGHDADHCRLNDDLGSGERSHPWVLTVMRSQRLAGSMMILFLTDCPTGQSSNCVGGTS